MTSSAQVIHSHGAVDSDVSNASRLAGLMLVAAVPALIWALLLNAGASAAGYDLSAKALFSFAATIATFLTAVCAPLMLRR
jgi:hypothetical protein